MTEINKSFVRAALIEKLSVLERHKFRFNKKRGCWTRPWDKDWSEIFFVDLIDYRPKFVLEPAICIRVEAVERIFHNTSGTDHRFQKVTPTISFALSGVRPELNLFRYEAFDEMTLNEACTQIVRDCDAYVLPFFAENNSIAALDRLLNDRPSDDCPYYKMDYLRCARGLILAALVSRRNYSELESIYRTRVHLFAGGFYSDRFEALIRDLRNTGGWPPL